MHYFVKFRILIIVLLGVYAYRKVLNIKQFTLYDMVIQELLIVAMFWLVTYFSMPGQYKSFVMGYGKKKMFQTYAVRQH